MRNCKRTDAPPKPVLQSWSVVFIWKPPNFSYYGWVCVEHNKELCNPCRLKTMPGWHRSRSYGKAEYCNRCGLYWASGHKISCTTKELSIFEGEHIV